MTGRPPWLDGVWGTVFLAAWILPVFYQTFSSVRPPWLPFTLWHFYCVTCLFPYRQPAWPMHYIQVRLEGDDRWITLPDAPYSTMRPFGHRTRLSHFLDRASEPEAWRALSAWTYRRYVRLHPDGPKPRAVRLVRASWQPALQGPQGHWRKPDVETFPPQHLTVLHTEMFDDGAAEAGRR